MRRLVSHNLRPGSPSLSPHEREPCPVGTRLNTALPNSRNNRPRPLLALVRWLDSWAGVQQLESTTLDPKPNPSAEDESSDSSESNGEVPVHPEPEGKGKSAVDWMRVLPFLGLHVACFAVIWVGFSWTALAVCVGLYLVRMFAITAGYHRYFSHRAFKTSRLGQFTLAILGASAAQRGPLWWAAHHRVHHRYSDKPKDVHSPKQKGLVWSHIGWVLSRKAFRTRLEEVPDLAKFRELRFLDRFDIIVPVALGTATFLVGWALAHWAPGLNVTGPQLLVWGFVISTVCLYHGTFTINSLAHVWGSRRYETSDTSRNNPLLALITLGEGWHNNHHHYPASARQGFYWWEVDLSFYVLRTLALFGLIWDLRPVPAHALNRKRSSN